MQGARILITGPTSQVAFPLARALARDNDVHGLARFKNDRDRARVEAIGVTCHAVDLASDSLASLPSDYDYVLNFAVVKSGDFDYDLAANAEGAGRLMSHCRRAKAFLHCSSAAVYEYAGQRPATEGDPLGDNHRVMFPSYSIAKIAAETVVRFSAREFGVPTTIARLSVPYGDNGGWPWFHLMMMKGGTPIPVHPDAPNVFNPLHEDDYIAQVPKLLEIASIDATTLNWGGPQASIEEWCAFLGELTGLEAKFESRSDTLGPLPLDLTRMHELVGKAQTPWRDGMRRLVKARNPELLVGAT
jgi:nucleoside-diphosphate-sugar epimerase